MLHTSSADHSRQEITRGEELVDACEVEENGIDLMIDGSFSTQAGFWMDPGRMLTRSESWIKVGRWDAFEVGQMIWAMEGEERKRGIRGCPMLPVVEVTKMLDMLVVVEGLEGEVCLLGLGWKGGSSALNEVAGIPSDE